MKTPFVLFGAAHLGALVATGAAIALFSVAARAARRAERPGLVGWVSAAVFLISFTGVILRNVHRLYHGYWTVQYDLPMQLCDWAYIALWYALGTRNQTAFELAYFWGLAGTLQAMLTPALDLGFPHLKFVYFFLLHGGIVAGALYMVLGLGLRPRRWSVLRVFLFSQLYPAVVLPLNFLIRANYGYLMQKPAGPNLMSVLGDWPWYILGLQLLALLFFGFFYLPFFWGNRRAVRRA